MVSPTERLRILTKFRNETGLDVADAIKLLSERYNRIEGWWCRQCEVAVTSESLIEHERKAHGRGEPDVSVLPGVDQLP